MLTIFTPTYNRQKLLKRVYESLKNQTSHDFIWLIVDDGSTDDTRCQIALWQQEQKIQIQYEYRANGGKMRAHNRGVELCTTELFVCLDSDDYFVNTAVEEILQVWKQEADAHIAGIAAHKGEDETIPLFHQEFPDVRRSTLRGLYRAGFAGETTLVYRTDLLKKNKFPEIEGEKYVPEDYIYDKIDLEYQLLILPRVLTVCEIVEGGYTDQAAVLRQKNPTGWFLYYEQRARLEPMSILKIKYISHYLCFSRYLGKHAWKESRLSRGELLLGTPGAWLLAAAGKM